MLSIGIIGLPNTGKSTLFNALMKRQLAEVASHPFTTIEPNVGIVNVPDERLTAIAAKLSLPKMIPATVKFIDIAGLVKNAHKGEGLGNQFLAHIGECDALVHLVRFFGDDCHPEEDRGIVETELELKDLEIKDEQPVLSAKPVLLVANVAENQIAGFNQTSFLPISAKIEAELAELPEKEQREYLRELGLKESSLNRLIASAYRLLNLITFYTLKDLPTSSGQVQAWPLLRGASAQEAAGKIHTDFVQKFIAAEVCGYSDFQQYNSWSDIQHHGRLRTEGRGYLIRDGDIIHFRHG